MWGMIAHFLVFTGGLSVGVLLMCLIQAGKRADEDFERMKRRERQDAV